MNYLGKKPILVIHTRCSRFVEPLKKALSDAGMWSFQSFDLRSTRAFHEGCSCPHHGTSQCTCELVVLLVYRPVGGPLTLILDGRDGDTFVFVNEENITTLRQASVETIEKAIQEAANSLIRQDALLDAE